VNINLNRAFRPRDHRQPRSPLLQVGTLHEWSTRSLAREGGRRDPAGGPGHMPVFHWHTSSTTRRHRTSCTAAWSTRLAEQQQSAGVSTSTCSGDAKAAADLLRDLGGSTHALSRTSVDLNDWTAELGRLSRAKNLRRRRVLGFPSFKITKVGPLRRGFRLGHRRRPGLSTGTSSAPITEGSSTMGCAAYFFRPAPDQPTVLLYPID